MYFSGLKPYLRSEAVGIGVLKGVQVAVCGIRCTYLNNDMLKILGNYFSYKKKMERRKKPFQDCNRYSTSIENMENQKPSTRRKNCYF